MVERGVEGGALVVRATADLDGGEAVAPGLAGHVLDVVEGAAGRVLGGEVGLGAGPADVRDADLDVHRAGAGLELHVSARALARDRPSARAEPAGAAARLGGAGAQLVVLPGAGGLEGAVEAGGEVEGVVVALALRVEVAAEVAGRDGTGDRMGLRVDADVRSRGPHLGVGGTDQQRGRLVGGVGEAAGARAGGRREVRGDAGGEADLVVPRFGGLVGVLEVRRVHRVLGVARRGRGDLARVREERDVTAAARAARAGHVREAEAADTGRVVLVPAGRGRAGGVAAGVLGAPGEHAEGDDGAREDIAAVPGADERVDVLGGVLDECRSR